ncbi:hypothetical protein K503DRAFT_505155 [Rhizopogon vinicolor AM-OR11-026]|uniref:Uncharacterized protein n=1 Tax=Rhizopogon vinicolor AM-OR11-026 TaxID=1314800 RepID=A0A1B7MM64_9AGAM|nr:hypothetical protein K503DRAFT_505155 [Rhizopogon vinicolor AM-OR11-026]
MILSDPAITPPCCFVPLHSVPSRFQRVLSMILVNASLVRNVWIRVVLLNHIHELLDRREKSRLIWLHVTTLLHHMPLLLSSLPNFRGQSLWRSVAVISAFTFREFSQDNLEMNTATSNQASADITSPRYHSFCSTTFQACLAHPSLHQTKSLN